MYQNEYISFIKSVDRIHRDSIRKFENYQFYLVINTGDIQNTVNNNM